MSYTPGQWIADSTTYPLEYWFETQVLHVGSVVAVVRAMSAEQSADHARLIAASPDLLQIAKELSEELRLIRMKDTHAVYDATVRIRAEIVFAKTEGAQ